MPNGHGGPRKGSGRPVTPARQWMRDIAADPEARENLLQACKTDPILYIRVFEAAHGRPPQCLKIVGDEEAPLQIVHQVTFADGSPLLASAAGLPEASPDLGGKG